MGGRRPCLPPDIWELFPDKLDDTGAPKGWLTREAGELFKSNPRELLKRGTNAPCLDMAALPTVGWAANKLAMRMYRSGSKFRDGDPLFARITPCLENGKTAHVFGLGDNVMGAGSTELIVIRPRSAIPRFSSWPLARDPGFRAHVKRRMTGTSGRQPVDAKSPIRYPVVAPRDSRLWQAFGKLIHPLTAKAIANAEHSFSLVQARDLLLPRLVSGKIRVNPS